MAYALVNMHWCRKSNGLLPIVTFRLQYFRQHNNLVFLLLINMCIFCWNNCWKHRRFVKSLTSALFKLYCTIWCSPPSCDLWFSRVMMTFLDRFWMAYFCRLSGRNITRFQQNCCSTCARTLRRLAWWVWTCKPCTDHNWVSLLSCEHRTVLS